VGPVGARPPLWLREQLKKGKKLEQFAIKRARPKKAA
jgi:hypothetical protein